MSFRAHYELSNWDQERLCIGAKTREDVERALNSEQVTLEDFKALISPAAAPFLATMVERSKALTRQRFGHVLQLFLPLYLSNKCHNICTYCGFSLNNKIRRTTLSAEQLEAEVAAIKKMGFEHLLLVSGEAPGSVGVPYFSQVLRQISARFAQISLEVQPLEEEEYRVLIALGLHAVMVYQETYNRRIYKQHHLRGNKRDFFYRLDTPDRLGRAGVNKIGLGALLGLADWRTDAFFVALHLRYLQKRYWRCQFSVSLPRLRPCVGMATLEHGISDRQFVQLLCAYRIFEPELELSLSTREPVAFRDKLFALGFTSVSAASSTQPGGYAKAEQQLEQFDISDNRPLDEVVAAIKKQGLEVVRKNWSPSFDCVLSDEDDYLRALI